ncbi:hypothetical protein ACOME3_006991 [Neoechinorhynchus agilis]
METVDLVDNSDGDHENEGTNKTQSFLTRYRHLFIAGVIAVVALIIFLIGFFVTRANRTTVIETYNRLPLDPRPLKYDLTFKFRLENKTFHGIDKIEVEVKNPTKYFFMNAENLENISASIEGAYNQNGLKVDYMKLDVIRVSTLADVEPGVYNLTIEYDGFIVANETGGLKASPYYPYQSGTQYDYLVFTDFSRKGARKAFPCWDEPSFKAVFDLKIVAPIFQIAISNMPLHFALNTTDPNYIVSEFFRSIPLATSMFGFSLGVFNKEKKEIDAFGIVHRVVTLDVRSGGYFFLSLSKKSLELISIYLKIFYPLPITSTFGTYNLDKPIEGMGLVIRDDELILIDEESSAVQKMELIRTVCKDSSRLWFGGYVTVDWWSDLWLTEGINEFISMLCSNGIGPEYDFYSREILDSIRPSLLLDSLPSSSPLQMNLSGVDEPFTISETVMRAKGASIMRMLSIQLNSAILSHSFQLLLARQFFGNVKPSDLFNSIEEVGFGGMSMVYSNWINTPGFPVISVLITTSEENGNKVINFEQREYFAEGPQTGNNKVWNIPITVIDTLILISLHNSEWTKINHQKSGYFITDYDNASMQKLKHGIVTGSMASSDKLDIELDQFLLSKAGYQPMSDYFDFVRIFRPLYDIYVWVDISLNLNHIYALSEYLNVTQAFNSYGQELYEPLASYLGFEPLPDEDKLMNILRTTVLTQAGMFRLESVVDEAGEWIFRAVSNPGLDMGFREAIFKINILK